LGKYTTFLRLAAFTLDDDPVMPDPELPDPELSEPFTGRASMGVG
jgi:hypothetical protein